MKNTNKCFYLKNYESFSPCLFLFNTYFAQHFSSEEWIELVLLSLDCLSMGIWSVRRLSSLSSIVSGQYTSMTRRVCFFHSTLNLFRYHNLLHFGSFFYNLSSNCRSDILSSTTFTFSFVLFPLKR